MSGYIMDLESVVLHMGDCMAQQHGLSSLLGLMKPC